jgi:hypothetical protein
MMYISIALTMLALVAGTFLLARTKTEAMGKFSQWISYAVIFISIGMLLCEIGRTGLRLMHRDGYGDAQRHPMGMMEYCPPEMCGGVPCMVPRGGRGMNCCNMGMHGGNGEMDCHHGGMGHEKGETKGKCCEDMEGMGKNQHESGDSAGKDR